MKTSPRKSSRPTPTVADEFADLLEPLGPRQRLSVIQYLSDAFYVSGSPPTREDVACLLQSVPCVSGRRKCKPQD